MKKNFLFLMATMLLSHILFVPTLAAKETKYIPSAAEVYAPYPGTISSKVMELEIDFRYHGFGFTFAATDAYPTVSYIYLLNGEKVPFYNISELIFSSKKIKKERIGETGKKFQWDAFEIDCLITNLKGKKLQGQLKRSKDAAVFLIGKTENGMHIPACFGHPFRYTLVTYSGTL